MGGTKARNVQISHKTYPQNNKNREASRNNKKANTAKVKELLRYIPEKSSKKESFKKNLICKSYKLYNIIPKELRTENPKRLKKLLKKYYFKTDEKDTKKYEVKKKKKKTARLRLMKSLAKKINADNVKIVSTEHTTENNNVQLVKTNSIDSPCPKKTQEDNMKNDLYQV